MINTMRHPFKNTWIRHLLLAVFVLPSLLPNGYMLSRNIETNVVEIVICVGNGLDHRMAFLDMESGQFVEQPEADVVGETVELCPFALLGVDDQLLSSNDVLSSVARPFVSFSYQTADAKSLALRPTSRGPPQTLS